MEQYERALEELRDWTIANSGGLHIIFAGHNPTFVRNIPHPWQCTASNGRQTKELYHAYGITIQEAVIKCHQRWLNQEFGYSWKEPDTEFGFMSAQQWFEYQQGKSG
ncbi:MAG: hypothetical protein KJ077_08405 [Anaerolineae bacterium]|nr:hypothetical protein [Anaerolineae bacterium]